MQSHRTGHTNSSYKFTGLLHLTSFAMTRKLLYSHLISRNNKFLWPVMYIWKHKYNKIEITSVFLYIDVNGRPFILTLIMFQQQLETNKPWELSLLSMKDLRTIHRPVATPVPDASWKFYTKFCAQGKYYMFNLSGYMLWFKKGSRSMQMHNPHTLHATLKVSTLEWDHLKHWKRSNQVNHNAPEVLPH